MQKAVSDRTGTTRLFINKVAPGDHTIYQSDDGGESVEIETVTLDDYFKDKRHPVNVIKMDIEGAEMAALLGMERIIRENEHLKIFTEFNPSFINKSGYKAEEYAYRLLEHGGFSAIVIFDYIKNRDYTRVNSVDEIIKLCENLRFVNLFVENGISDSRG